MKRVDKNRMRVVFTNKSDPGGIIPLAVIHLMMEDNPFKTIEVYRE